MQRELQLHENVAWRAFTGDFPALHGSGHVVAYNRVTNFHDGIDHATYGMPDGYPNTPRDRMPVSNDFYGNDVSNMHDNCFETDGGMHNMRVFRNRCFNAAVGAMSPQPIFGGPVYFIRNVVYNSVYGPLKIQADPSGILVYQNTYVGEIQQITPASNLTVRLIGDYGKQKQNCCIGVLAGAITTYDNDATIANNFNQRVARAGYTPLPFTPFARITDADSHFQANMDTWGVSGQVDWDVGPLTVTSVTASRQWNWFPANDADSIALPQMLKSQLQNNQRQFSQEFRLASNGSHRIDYVLGAYYFYQIVRGTGATQYGSASANWLFPAQDPVVANAATNGFEAASKSTPKTHSYALFGQTVWHIGDALSLTTGLRYTHEKKAGSFVQTQVAGLSLAGLTPAQQATAQGIRNQLNPNISYSAETKDNSLSGLATLAWKAGRDVLVYATYGRGNKSGGLNLSNLPAGISAVVEPEKVDNYEIGVKSQLFDHALTLNAAAFWTDVANYQTAITQQIVGTTNFRNYITNIPLARSRGVEADAVWSVTSRVSLNLSGAYTEAYYVDYKQGPTPVEALNPTAAQPGGFASSDLSGKPLAGVPKWAFTAGGDASQPLGGRAELYGHADYSWRSSFYTAVCDSRYTLVPSYGIGNARVGVRLDDGRFDLSVWAKNIFDKDYFQTLSIVATGLITANLGDPRTFGATFRVRI